MDKELKYNYNEFVAFLLLYASHADLEFSTEEKSKIMKLLPNDDFENIYNDFKNVNDFQALQIILSYKGVYYPTPEQKEELISKLVVQFFSDGNFDPIEQELLHFLEKLL
jgi:hypothetical protein